MSNWSIASILQPYEQPTTSVFSAPAKATISTTSAPTKTTTSTTSAPAKATTSTTSAPAKATINTYTGSAGLVEQNQSVVGQAFTPAPQTSSGGYVVTPFSASPTVTKSVQALTSNVNNTASQTAYNQALVQQATSFLGQNPTAPATAVGKQVFPLAQAVVSNSQPTTATTSPATTSPATTTPIIPASLTSGFTLSTTELILIGGGVIALILLTKGGKN